MPIHIGHVPRVIRTKRTYRKKSSSGSSPHRKEAGQMPISPADYEEFAVYMLRVYEEAEAIMLRRVARRLARGIDEEGWAERKLSEIVTLRREILQVLNRLKEYNRDIAGAISKAYSAGVSSADNDMGAIAAELKAKIEGTSVTLRLTSDIEARFGTIKQSAVNAIVRSTITKLEGIHMRILRDVDDIYRQVIAETAVQVNTGTLTRREAAQRALNRFTERGITGFVDRAGRRWEMASYVEMAVRSASGQAAIEGHINRIQSYGHDLVFVSDAPGECEKCRPWENKVLSITGNTPGYPSLVEARAAGLFHPRCRHRVTAYIEGFTIPKAKTEDPVTYKLKQKQRYIERTIRQWKRREAVAITEQERKHARAKV